MKTHTSRWQNTVPGVWILKARARDGGAMLATITDRDGYICWQLTGGALHDVETRHDAQRAVRKALEEAANGYV